MGKQGFNLKINNVVLNETLFTAADFGVSTDPGDAGTSATYVLVTDEINNVVGQTPYDSLSLVLRYTEESPTFPQSWNIDARVEGKVTVDGVAQWKTMAGQFEPFRRASQGPERQILMQPNLIVLDPGVDEYIDEGGVTVARVSRTQDRLTTESWRVKFILTENDVQGATAFAQVKLTGFGEMYNAV